VPLSEGRSSWPLLYPQTLQEDGVPYVSTPC
jgi:hypothetical protein